TAKGPPGNRVVVVSKEINEFIYWVGAENHVVAHDLTSVYPPQIEKKTSIGYHRALSAEGIISMHPSTFLTDGNFGPPAVYKQLKMVGIPIKIIPVGPTMADAQKLMLEVGAYFGRDARAETVVAQWKINMAKVMQAAKLWANRPKPKVVMVHFGQAENVFLAVQGGTAGQIMTWAGADNALAGQHGMARLTPAMMADAQPEVILANQLAFSKYGNAKAFATMPGVSLTPAGQNLRIYEIDQGDVIYFSPRTPANILKVARYLHPNVFKSHPELTTLYHELLKEQP
ncbi:MAG: heme/hemin ABC transporter substrate-binding protein, partial [Gammaproteobacteria bacterium]